MLVDELVVIQNRSNNKIIYKILFYRNYVLNIKIIKIILLSIN